MKEKLEKYSNIGKVLYAGLRLISEQDKATFGSTIAREILGNQNAAESSLTVSTWNKHFGTQSSVGLSGGVESFFDDLTASLRDSTAKTHETVKNTVFDFLGGNEIKKGEALVIEILETLVNNDDVHNAEERIVAKEILNNVRNAR